MIASKSKVAPLVSCSIPRLELMGAIVGLRLTNTICLVLDIPLKDVTYWTDSLNTLWCIRGRSREFKPFVANRIGEIHRQSNPDQWRHVPTKDNPADILSRGAKVQDMNDSLWWSGPEFLVKEKADWPINRCESKNIDKSEMKKGERTLVTVPLNEQQDDETIVPEWRLDPLRYSSWHRCNVFECFPSLFGNV
ncbi:uncharacterized protein LOC135503442 [Lineus longissimus]|uniref:uncharacterized protein LOC135503442 n=1 Tax=Lineus longissimus TaxID=88925 RepID=UPI00315D9169